jgi:hypothetical protein
MALTLLCWLKWFGRVINTILNLTESQEVTNEANREAIDIFMAVVSLTCHNPDFDPYEGSLQMAITLYLFKITQGLVNFQHGMFSTECSAQRITSTMIFHHVLSPPSSLSSSPSMLNNQCADYSLCWTFRAENSGSHNPEIINKIHNLFNHEKFIKEG